MKIFKQRTMPALFSDQGYFYTPNPRQRCYSDTNYVTYYQNCVTGKDVTAPTFDSLLIINNL
jgi:hypothetical protein